MWDLAPIERDSVKRQQSIDDDEANMPTKHLIRLTIMTCGIFAAALVGGQPAPAAAQAETYPWCTVGEEVHCYYTTQQQCEETADYRGFCERNPDMPAQDNTRTRRAYPR
jgi:hypothetical protein